MKRVLVFDVPVRMFHWLMAVFFLTAIIIANTVDDESATFSYHMMAGMMIGVLLVFRIIWGFIGTTYARFSTFMLKPSQLLGYFKEVIGSKTTRYLNHNPASSFVAMLMFIAVIGLLVSGYMMVGAGQESAKEVHEIFAKIFFLSVVVHIIGVVYHQIRHQDGMITSMIDGKKEPVKGQQPNSSQAKGAGVVLLIVVIGFLWFLNANFDSKTRVLNVFGTELILAEPEEGESH